MRLYIANTTRQNWDLRYTVPEARRPRQQQITAGGQIQVSEDLSQEAVDGIIEQLEMYGIADARKVAQQRDHISLLWSVGQPVTRNQMLQALERNLAVMDARGQHLRQEAALTASTALAAQSTSEVEYKGIEMFVEEKKGANGAEPVMHEQHVVDHSGAMRYEGRQGGAPTPPKRGRARRRAA